MRYLFLILLLPLMASCADDLRESVPSTRVEAKIDIDVLQLQLTSHGGYAIYTTRANEAPYIGYGGLLILRSLFDDTFYSYDLSCPVEARRDVRVSVEDGIKVTCKKCGSEFSGVFYGDPSPSYGEAVVNKVKLRTYYTAFSQGTNVVTVINNP